MDLVEQVPQQPTSSVAVAPYPTMDGARARPAPWALGPGVGVGGGEDPWTPPVTGDVNPWATPVLQARAGPPGPAPEPGPTRTLQPPLQSSSAPWQAARPPPPLPPHKTGPGPRGQQQGTPAVPLEGGLALSASADSDAWHMDSDDLERAMGETLPPPRPDSPTLPPPLFSESSTESARPHRHVRGAGPGQRGSSGQWPPAPGQDRPLSR